MMSLTSSGAALSRKPVLLIQEMLHPTLLWQLIYASILVLLTTILAIWFVATQSSDGYKMMLAERYDIDPSVAHMMFIDSLRFAFFRVGIVAIFVAGAVSTIMTRRILKPLREMAEQVEQITAGEFGVRVDIERIPHRCEIRMLGSSLNEMADKLETLERLRRDMVSNLAHDLLTPLTNLRGYLEGLRDGVVKFNNDIFAMLEGQVGRLVRLVEDLHQLAVVDSSKTNLVFETFATEPLLKEASAIFESELRPKNMLVEFATEEDAQMLTADREKILRIVRNLVQNAARYSYEGGTIGLSARRIKQKVEIRCVNVGAEIPDDDINFIFDRFYRAEIADAESQSGAGLGLAIVKELAEAHGGSVGASSSDDETAIWVLLPAGPIDGDNTI